MQFSVASFYFLPLKFKYSPQHHVVKHPHCSSLNVRDQVSHPYKATGKIIVRSKSLNLCSSLNLYHLSDTSYMPCFAVAYRC
jgi:hypothetical protein